MKYYDKTQFGRDRTSGDPQRFHNVNSLVWRCGAAGVRALPVLTAHDISLPEQYISSFDAKTISGYRTLHLTTQYAFGKSIDEFVWMPSDRYTEHRDIMFAYRDTSKEVTRISNRIWSVCSRKGYKLPIKSQQTKALSRLRRPEVTHTYARRASFSTTSLSNFQQGS